MLYTPTGFDTARDGRLVVDFGGVDLPDQFWVCCTDGTPDGFPEPGHGSAWVRNHAGTLPAVAIAEVAAEVEMRPSDGLVLSSSVRYRDSLAVLGDRYVTVAEKTIHEQGRQALLLAGDRARNRPGARPWCYLVCLVVSHPLPPRQQNRCLIQ